MYVAKCFKGVYTRDYCPLKLGGGGGGGGGGVVLTGHYSIGISKATLTIIHDAFITDSYTHWCSRHIHKHSKTGEVGATALHHCVVPILRHLNCSHPLHRPTTTANSEASKKYIHSD